MRAPRLPGRFLPPSAWSSARVGFVAWWISGGVIVLGVVVLAVVAAAVAGRLRPLKRALRRLQLRLEETEKLQTSVAALQDRAISLQDQLEAAQERTELRRGAREVSAPDKPT